MRNLKNSTLIPKNVFCLKLKPLQFVVYCSLYRDCFLYEDRLICTHAQKQLAEFCNITVRILYRVLKELEKPNSFLGVPLISTTHRLTEYGDKDTNLITITPIYEEE